MQRCKEFCFPTISRCTNTPCPEYSSRPEYSNYKHLSFLIDEAFKDVFLRKVNEHSSFHELLAHYSSMKDFVNESLIHKLNTCSACGADPDMILSTPLIIDDLSQNSTYGIAVQSFVALTKLWLYSTDEQLPGLRPDTTSFSDLHLTAHVLWKHGRDAAIFFNSEQLYPYAEKDIYEFLVGYQDIFSNTTLLFPPECLVTLIPPLLTGVVLQSLKRTVLDAVPEVSKTIQSITPKLTSQKFKKE